MDILNGVGHIMQSLSSNGGHQGGHYGHGWNGDYDSGPQVTYYDPSTYYTPGDTVVSSNPPPAADITLVNPSVNGVVLTFTLDRRQLTGGRLATTSPSASAPRGVEARHPNP